MGRHEECEFLLTPESLESMLEYCDNKYAPKDENNLLRFKKMKIATETFLLIWAEKLGENTLCHATARSRFGRKTVEYRAPGRMVNPFEESDEIRTLSIDGTSIFSRLGVVPEYHYADGCNILKIWIPKSSRSGILPTLLAVVLAVVVGLGLKKFSPDLAANLSEYVFSPALSILSRCLSVLSGPLVFLALTTGIIGIGDINSFKKTGGVLLSVFLIVDILCGILAFIFMLPFISIADSSVSGGTSSLGGIIRMLVEMFPKDIVSPFSTGNTIQIIVLAFAFGLAVIYLENSVPDLRKLPLQLYDLVNVLLSGFSKFLPALVFLSISSIIITSTKNVVGDFALIFFITMAASITLELILLVILKVKKKNDIGKLLKSQMKYVAVALATASSAVVLPFSIDSCKKDLGLDGNYVNVMLPIGQLMSQPPFIALYVSMVLVFSAVITPGSIIVTIFVSTILCISAPPVAGVGASMVMLLFAQLGISDENIGLAIGITMVMDYLCTGIKNLMIPQQLLICSSQSFPK